MMRAAAVALLALVFTGCSTTDYVSLENRAACSYDGKEAYVISKWWSFYFGSQLAPADARELCKKVNR